VRKSIVSPPQPRAFVDILKEANDKAAELRGLLLELMNSPPSDEAAWLDAMTDAATPKGLGHLMILGAKNNAWIMETAKQIGDMIGKLTPAYVPAFLASFEAGEVEAEMACPCGECVPCAMRREQGEEKARHHLAQQFYTRKKQRRGAGLFGPDGRPLQ